MRSDRLVLALAAPTLTVVLVLASCSASPASDTAPAVPGAAVVPATPSATPSPTVTAGWALPASWSDIPPLTGLTVLSTSVAIGVDGVLREATILVDGVQDVGVTTWIAALPDAPVTTHADYSTASGDTEIRLSSGSNVSRTAADLPAGWRETLPLGPAETVYAFAGTEYRVLADGSTPEPPVFDLGFDRTNRVTDYRAWLETQPGWTVTTLSDLMFRGESDDFTVVGMLSSDGTDELTITPLRWDVPGIDALKP